MNQLTAGNIFLQILTSVGASGFIGYLFMLWINTKFDGMKSYQDELKSRIKELEDDSAKFLAKHDHFAIRKEDRESIDRQLIEMKKDIREMPDKIVGMIKQFVKQ